MKRKRGRGASTRKPTTKRQPRSTAHAPSAGRDTRKTNTRKPSRPRPVSDPDSEVFLPSCSGVAAYTETLTTKDEDTVDVFMPTKGKPVTVQSDWIDDSKATVRHDSPLWEPFAGIRPRAGSPVGWSPAELYVHGLELYANNKRVRCRFGCAGTTTNVHGVSHHHYTCAFWTRDEGKHSTPF